MNMPHSCIGKLPLYQSQAGAPSMLHDVTRKKEGDGLCDTPRLCPSEEADMKPGEILTEECNPPPRGVVMH